MWGTGKVDLWANGNFYGWKIPHWGIKWMTVQWPSQRWELVDREMMSLVCTYWTGAGSHVSDGDIKQAMPTVAPQLMRKLGAGKTQASGVDEIAEGQHRLRRNEHTQ